MVRHDRGCGKRYVTRGPARLLRIDARNLGYYLRKHDLADNTETA
jgi:hypothetical protein